MTANAKDGEGLCQIFRDMIDHTEIEHKCVVISFTTDADGGSKKGHVLLGEKQPWLILPSCWAHQASINIVFVYAAFKFISVPTHSRRLFQSQRDSGRDSCFSN